MAKLLSETWTGSDGAGWPAAWQAQVDQTGTATIQGNAGRLVARSASVGAARRQTVSSLPSGDYDIVVAITVPAGQPYFIIGIAWRADGTSDPVEAPGSRIFPLNGHSLRLDTNGDMYLYRHNGGSVTEPSPGPTNVGALVGTGARKIRVQQQGTAIRVRVWAGTAAEPSVWSLSVTDAGAWTGGGKLSFGVAASFDGATADTPTVSFDDLVVSDFTTNPTPGPFGVRRDWASMNATDRKAVIDGFQRAKSSGVYDNLTRMHQQAMVGASTDWHSRSIFPPVHRWFLTQIESAMGVAVPYWDWTSQAAFPTGLGGNGDAAQGYRVTSGPFANWVSVVFNSGTGAFSTRTGIIRRFGSAASSLPTAAQLTGVLNQTTYDSSPWDASVPSGLRNWLEGWTGNPVPAMHNRVHDWVGGDMTVGTSPNDPVFWMHHANVDRIWAGWQKRYGVTKYAGPAGQGPNDPMPFTGGVTPAQMFVVPAYDKLP